MPVARTGGVSSVGSVRGALGGISSPGSGSARVRVGPVRVGPVRVGPVRVGPVSSSGSVLGAGLPARDAELGKAVDSAEAAIYSPPTPWSGKTDP
jgi:hypothetical protein